MMKDYVLLAAIVLAVFFVPRLHISKVWPVTAECSGRPSIIFMADPNAKPGQGA